MVNTGEPSDSRPMLPPCDHAPARYTGPGPEEILALRRDYLGPGAFTYYRRPLCILEGRLQYVWDHAGRRYLDAVGGIASISVGHCHPKVTAAACEQLNRLVHTTTLYLHPTVVALARVLAAHMPHGSGLQAATFANSGSEANDLATMMARLHTGRSQVLALQNGYHGGTQTTMAFTALGTWRFPLPTPQDVAFCPPGYCYRCPFGLSHPGCDLKCARSVENTIRYETCGEVACFIAEAVQGVGGVVVPPPGYFQIVYDIVRRHGGLCIADEVQAGLGRTGRHFWAFENWGVVPDMVTVAKGIANGAPLSACVTRQEVAASMTRRLHFNTFAGNPVSAAQALAVLRTIEEERLRDNAERVGAYLKTGLLALQERCELIGEVRGMGLLIGIELVKNRVTKEPAGEVAAEVCERARDRGLLVGKSGLSGNVLRLTPPLCLTRDDAEFVVDCLAECLPGLGG
ncbi:MAG TPA: aspartate aminotransferase family protein [Phycisphaerae bacterium]|nr:aspartate aminotransferase family protein [Phycisphaerae bacterium]HRY67753.1 aspartate aminotransferase family protein [Phycisphaerae bacterium]HSA25205.1 aspartate aminotransferase family protein [Phycisphaerae bacterium]